MVNIYRHRGSRTKKYNLPKDVVVHKFLDDLRLIHGVVAEDAERFSSMYNSRFASLIRRRSILGIVGIAMTVFKLFVGTLGKYLSDIFDGGRVI